MPEASEDLLSLGKLTKTRYSVVMQAGILELLYADPSREGEVALRVTGVSDVFPISLRAAERTREEVKQVTKVLKWRGSKVDKVFAAFPRVVSVKHIG